MDNKNNALLAQNRKAHFNYFLSDFCECGIALVGTEVKSLRENGCSIGDAYVVFRQGNAEIINMNIPLYKQGNIFNHETLRTRRLLMHKKEIKWFELAIKKGGYTVVPTKVYFKKGKVKVEIALGKGKKNYDKKQTIKERDIQRELDRGYD
jgi:SsrA-binding protein